MNSEKAFKFAVAFAYDYVIPFVFYNALQELKEHLGSLTQKHISLYNSYWDTHKVRSDELESLVKRCEQEWQLEGRDWNKKLRSLIIKYREIEPDLAFNETQHTLLQLYYLANKLLVNCLNNACVFNNEIREEVENMLLLPFAEIKKCKPGTTLPE